MANVTVFVDDAVLGNLPGICVIDGIATADRLTIRRQVSGSAGFGVAWLLILAGPLGWLGLAAIALNSAKCRIPHRHVAIFGERPAKESPGRAVSAEGLGCRAGDFRSCFHCPCAGIEWL